MRKHITNYLAIILTTAVVFLAGAIFGVWVSTILLTVSTELPKASITETVVPETQETLAVEPSEPAPAPLELAAEQVAEPETEPAPEAPVDPIPAWMDGADVDEWDQATARALIFSNGEWNIASHYDARRMLWIKDPVARMSALHFYAVTHYGGWDEAKAWADSHQGAW